MIVHRVVEPTLAQVGYIIGCPVTHEALVIDPTRDIAPYVAAAAAQGLHITTVTETHIHADFVSGARALAAHLGVTLALSGEGGDGWGYQCARDAGARLLHPGDTLRIGTVHVEVLHTPGHTPEHLSFLVTDAAQEAGPPALFTGDFVFVGDVGRPDLLERAVGVTGSAEYSARQLFHSLHQLDRFPASLHIWPGHGAGSACGKALGDRPSTTLGDERRSSWAFQVADEDAFVAELLRGQPEPPAYFGRLKVVNRDCPPSRPSERPPHLAPARYARALEETLVIDLRSASAFAAGHLPGTLNIPLNRAFATWAGALLPADRNLTLLAADERVASADEAVRSLELVGLDRVTGILGVDALRAAQDAGVALETTEQMQVVDLAEAHASVDRAGRNGVYLLDVRGRAEWEAGHMPGAHHVPLTALPARLAELPRDRPIVVHCQSGARSAIATSLIRAAGLARVADLTGGFAAWQEAGQPVVRGA